MLWLRSNGVKYLWIIEKFLRGGLLGVIGIGADDSQMLLYRGDYQHIG